MKRKLVWVCLLVSPLVIGGTVLFLLPRDPITQANCDRIKQGMSEAEVVAILGREKDELQWGWFLTWKGPTGSICVHFPTGDRRIVRSAVFRQSQPKNILEKLRDWLGL